ncbi:hypothetical protein SESBI_32448 [Sesbania bispinosa]|nr:hypothetical protein SESBI_32448 [Sesbania bispinosa]
MSLSKCWKWIVEFMQSLFRNSSPPPVELCNDILFEIFLIKLLQWAETKLQYHETGPNGVNIHRANEQPKPHGCNGHWQIMITMQETRETNRCGRRAPNGTTTCRFGSQA